MCAARSRPRAARGPLIRWHISVRPWAAGWRPRRRASAAACRRSNRSRRSRIKARLKVAQLADLHLGFRQIDRLTPRGTNQREAGVADAFRRTLNDVIPQRPALLPIAGE